MAVAAEDKTERGPALSISIRGSKYEAFVCIDSLINDTSSGGVRIADRVPQEEVALLAREMTCKYSFFGLPKGGAKTGIGLEEGLSAEERGDALRDFGRRLGGLVRAGIYYPGMDMGCGDVELRQIYAGAGIELGRITDTSYFTALSVRDSILASVEATEDPGRPVTLAIEGLGRVAAHLLRMLPGEKFRLLAFSTVRGGRVERGGFSLPPLLELQQRIGDEVVSRIEQGERIARERVLQEPVDILIPSARTQSIHEGSESAIGASAVVPVANAPYTESALQTLHGRGVVCLPGFVTNGGGIYGSRLYDLGVEIPRIDRFSASKQKAVVRKLLESSRATGLSAVDLARRVAERHLRQVEGLPRPGGWEARLRRLASRVGPRGRISQGALRELGTSMDRVLSELEGMAHGG
jgi:glutamate dehydrogenase/leucine dehydrogenase